LSEVAKSRRLKAQRRVDLYRDRSERVLRAEMLKIFSRSAASRRERVESFSWLAQAQSLYKRVINEVAGPVYNPPPMRTVRVGDGVSASDQVVFDKLATQMRLDRRMDLACRMVQVCNRVLIHDRYVVSLKRVVRDVITPNSYSAIYHPDDPTTLLAVNYRRERWVSGKFVEEWVYWDDAEAFVYNERGSVEYVLPAAAHPGILPFIDVHVRELSCEEEDQTTGDDLEAAHLAVCYTLTQALRLIHTQGHTQVAINGDPANFPRDQIIDPENPLFAGAGNTASAIWNPTTVDGHMKLAEYLTMTAGANHGLNRDRMNAVANQASDGAGMNERRAELVQIMNAAETRAFEMLKVVSLSGELRLSAESQLACDFPDTSAKVDRKELLAIRKEERHMGLSSVVKDKLADAPYLGGDREKARMEIQEDLEDEAWYVELRRAQGISGDATSEEPGQDQAHNGAMGPKVRDGEMSKDAAASEAKSGPLRSIEALSK
jgi:hypothetical protein